jgi:hypothetical protein
MGHAFLAERGGAITVLSSGCGYVCGPEAGAGAGGAWGWEPLFEPRESGSATKGLTTFAAECQ